MKLITAIIRPATLEQVKHALYQIHVGGMTISDVEGFGIQNGHTEVYRGTEYQIDCVPKLKIEIVTDDDKVENILTAISTAAYTGKIGDGKIWVTAIETIIQVRTKERGNSAPQ